MDDPLPVAKGREVSTKPLLKSSGAPGLDGSTVAPGAEGYEVGAHQLIHSPELSACEKVLEPALDDISMLAGGDVDLAFGLLSESFPLWC